MDSRRLRALARVAAAAALAASLASAAACGRSDRDRHFQARSQVVLGTAGDGRPLAAPRPTLAGVDRPAW
jgi:hypothetical protein